MSEQWTLDKWLADGGFSTIYLLKEKPYVGKVISKSKETAYKYVENEINLHKNLKHENIIEMVSFCETEFTMIMVFKYFEFGSLDRLITNRRRIPEIQCVDLFSQMLNGLQYLKNNNIVHRDIKPGNILLHQNIQKSLADDDAFAYDIKITDFGFATLATLPCDKELGTPNFIAPELITTHTDKTSIINVEHNFKIDIWSLGATCYTCVVGTPPFETKDIKSTYNLIRLGSFVFPERYKLSAHGKSLIESMMTNNVEKRWSVEQLMDHPFFIKN
jgi:serine/threonine protein kinase